MQKPKTHRVFLTHNNQTLSLTEWARRRNIKKQTLSIRIKRGWPVAQALEFETRKPK